MLTIFTGQGVIGKLVLHLVTSLADKKLALAIDEKKRACRSFVELYHFTDRLEELTIELSQYLQGGASHGYIEAYRLEMIQRSIALASNRFLESRLELNRTVDILDPVLAESLHQLYDLKYAFLMSISHGLVDLEPSKDGSVSYLEPDDRIVSIDMDKYARWHSEMHTNPTSKAERVEWPYSLLWSGEYEVAFTPARLVLSDRDQARELAKRIDSHAQSLSEARILLRQFLQKNFSVEDILYVSRNLDRESW